MVWVVVVNQVAKLFSVTGTSPGIGIENHVASSRIELNFCRETVTIICKWPAMDFQQKRVFLFRVEVWRLDNPALNFSAIIRRLVPYFLNFTQHFMSEQILIQMSDSLSILIPGGHGNISRITRTGMGIGKSAVCGYRKRTAG